MGNVIILVVAQALSGFGTVTLTLLGGIIGVRIAPDPALATLPVTIAILALASATVPASFIMGKWGRRRVFIAAAFFSALSALLAASAVEVGSFFLFCVAAGLLGSSWAFAQQYRFAAAESVESAQVSRAVSAVMLGTLGAALFAPVLAVQSRFLWDQTEFTGSFIMLSVVLGLAGLTLFFFKNPAATTQPTPSAEAVPKRPSNRPLFLIAVLAGVVAYGVMSLVMTATPISMHVLDGHDVEQTAFVIQSHVVAMYLPSLVSGWLIARFGVYRMMIVGVSSLAVSSLFALVGHDVHDYWLSLVALGIGWNFLFVSGTTLLTQTYGREDRVRAQAINEFSVFGTMAAASLGAGVLIQLSNWETINIATLPILAGMLAASLWASQKNPRSSKEGTS